MYYVIELQTNDAPAHVVTTYTTLEDALSAFYYTLSFAAKSSVVYHTCMVINESGKVIESKCFMHPQTVSTEE